MHNLKNPWKRITSLLLSAVLLLGSTSGTALATEPAVEETDSAYSEHAFQPLQTESEYEIQPLHAEGEEGEEETDETPRSIQIYNGKTPNQNGTLTYTVTNHENGAVSEVYDVNDTNVTAVPGDTITLYPKAKDDSYVLSSIGYIRADRLGQSFNIKSVTDNNDGTYSFEMPARDIYVGAAFYKADDYYVLGSTGASNSIANVEPLHELNLILNQAWLNASSEEVSANVYLDTRILEFEELTGKTMTFRMEVRELTDSGFILAGSNEYTTAELKALVNNPKYCDGEPVKATDKDRSYYLLKDVVIPVDSDHDFTVDSSHSVYCTAMFTLDGWTDGVGAKYYRWGYSGGDQALILENNVPLPTPKVFFYNLEPETYQGYLAAEAVKQVEEEMGVSINIEHFTPDNMTERIGYLAEWPGYESYGELGVDRFPSTKTYKKKIVLCCNMPASVMDNVINHIRDAGVGNYIAAKLLPYGASKSFEEFYKSQEQEGEIFTAALALSMLTYEAHEAVPEATYGTHELWEEFQTAYGECVNIIKMTAEQPREVYVNARAKLLDVYLRIIGKKQLTTDFEFVIEDYDEDQYKVTVKAAEGSEWPEDLQVDYRWYDASKENYLIISKNSLNSVKCTISAKDDGVYYGFKAIALSPPGELEYKVSTTDTFVSVSFTKYETLVNTPEPINYTAELYLYNKETKEDELVGDVSNQTAETLTFDNLELGQKYTLKIYATNIVGRTTYYTETIETPYTINIYNGQAPNQNGKLTYTITRDKIVSERYDVEDTDITAFPGDIITLYPEANEGYALSSIGYVRADRVGQSFNLKDATDNKDGSYSFEMPEQHIYVGAAFYDEDAYYILKSTGTGNTVANMVTQHIMNTGLNQAWIKANADTVSVDMYLDTRILEFAELPENEGKEMIFRMEIREKGDGTGYIEMGSQEYTIDELKALIAEKQIGDEPMTDSYGRSYYYLRDIIIPVYEDMDFTAGDLTRSVYCAPMFTLKDYWYDAVGAPCYRWSYSGGDQAFILDSDTADEDIPQPMVYFYNLEPETYQGYLAAEAVKQLENDIKFDIDVRYFTPENMTECLGYLAQWPGYESRGELGVHREPSTKSYKKKIILYCNLPSTVRDQLGNYIREAGVTGYLAGKLTDMGAAQTFEEFYHKQETESEVFTAALSLSLLAYEAFTAVPEKEYGNDPLWPEFKAAYDEAMAIVSSATEQEQEVYTNARLKLRDVYLRILKKKDLTTEFKFVINEIEGDNKNYKITVEAANGEWPEDLNVTYRWYDASTNDYLIISKSSLNSVNCTITAADDGAYYGFKYIALAPPGELEYSITNDETSISVGFTKYETLTNTPEPITYAAELYLGEALQQKRSNTTGETLVFADLDMSRTYTLKIYATNIVGRTTIHTETVEVGSEMTVDGKKYGGSFAFSTLDFTNTEIFANGADDAYLVTINGETKVVGDTTLKNWAGNWETWQDYIYPSEDLLKQYPYLEEVWELAYAAYIKAFEGTFMEETIKEQYKTVDDLKKYWFDMTGTNKVSTIQVQEADGDYLLSWKDAEGKVLASDSYTMTGKVLNGLEGATMYVFTADNLAADSNYKYLVTMVPDMEGSEETPIAKHYHFQFGSDLSKILANGQLNNGYTYDDSNKKVSDLVDKLWYATMTDADASDVSKYNVILGMHRADKWSELPNTKGNSLTLNESYLLVGAGQEFTLDATLLYDAEIAWTVDNDDIVALKSNGTTCTVTAKEAGSCYVMATVEYEGQTYTARCRVDVTAVTPKDAVTGVHLATTKVTSYIHSKNFAQFDVLFDIKNEEDVDRSSGDTNSIITSAEFASADAAELFQLSVVGNQTLQIKPIDSSNITKSSYTSAIVVTIGDETFKTPEKLTISVKKDTKPTVSVSAVKLNAFFANATAPLVFTCSNGEVTEVALNTEKANPDWLELNEHDMTITVKDQKKHSGKLNLLVTVSGYDERVPVTVSVSTAVTKPTVKLSASSVTMYPDAALSNGAKLSLVSSNKKTAYADLGVTKLAVAELSSLTEKEQTTYAASSSYKVETFNSKTGEFTLKVKDGSSTAAGKVLLKVTFGDESNTMTLPLTVKVSKGQPTIKLSKSSITLNPALGVGVDSYQIAVTVTPADFKVEKFDIAVEDSKGNDKSDELDVTQSGNVLTVTTNSTKEGATYKVKVNYEGTKGATLTVKTSQDKLPTVTLTAKGTIDTARLENSSVILTPKYKNYNGFGQVEETFKVYATNKKDKTDKTDITKQFTISDKNSDGTYTLRATGDFVFDSNFKYSVTVTGSRNGRVVMEESKAANLTVKQGSVKVTPDVKTIQLITNDPYDEDVVTLSIADETVMNIADVTIQNANSSFFDIEYLRSGKCIISFKNNKVAEGIKKSTTVKLQVWLEGNNSEKPNATVSVKVIATTLG